MMKKQKGFSVIEVLFVLVIISLVVSAGWYVWSKNMTKQTASSANSDTLANQNVKKISSEINNVNIDQKSAVQLPSGAIINLSSFIFNPNDHKTNSNGIEENTFKHSQSFKAYHRGYIYSFDSYKCHAENVNHGDYTSLDITNCDFTIHIKKSDPPKINYNEVETKISSQSRQIYDHSLKDADLVVSSSMPYFRVEVPYMQFWGDDSGKVWGAGGNELTVGTVFGEARLSFQEDKFADNLKTKHAQTATVGPVAVSINMNDYSCFRPYLNSDGKCSPYSLNGKPAYTFNRVDYTLKLSQKSFVDTDRLILHY